MALTIGDKAHRILKFLLGFRNQRIRSKMARYGLTPAVVQEGWTLLQALGRGRMGRSSGILDVDTLQKLDDWENTWFPIISASLLRHAPKAHARFFLNLSQTDGPEVAVSVQTMVERLQQMSDPRGPYGAEGPKARSILEERGLNAAEVARVTKLLGSLQDVKPSTTSLEEEEAEILRAEKAVWDWYLEWSQVARVAVKERALLRQLGFLSRKQSEEEDDDVTPEEPVAPGAPAAPPVSGTSSTAAE